MTRERQLFVPLAGGLGNQLFQFAHALSKSEGSQIILLTNVLSPRLSKGAAPEILDFELGNQVTTLLSKKKTRKYLQKIFSLIIRIGAGEAITLLKKAAFLVLSPVASLLMKVETGDWVRVIASSNIGFCGLEKYRKSSVFIGYFQTYSWMESNPKALQQIKCFHPKSLSLPVRKLIEETKSRKILGLHIRLGDYKSEPKIGLLPVQYYVDATNHLSLDKYDEIWVFTNDEMESKTLLPNLVKYGAKWIPETFSSAETLYLMSYCNDLIISNSTFSWWGAFLNKHESHTIICPEIWFEKMKDPVNICPNSWIKVQSFTK